MSRSKQPFKWIANENTFLTNYTGFSDPQGYPLYDAGFNGLPIANFWIQHDFQADGYDHINPLSAQEIAPLYWLHRGIVSDASVDVPIITTTDQYGNTFTNITDYDDNLTDPDFGDGLLSLDVDTDGYYPQERSLNFPEGRQYNEFIVVGPDNDNPNPFRAKITVNTGGPKSLKRLYRGSSFFEGGFLGYGMDLGEVFVEVDNSSTQDNQSVSKRIRYRSYFETALPASTSLTYGTKTVTYSEVNILGATFFKEVTEIVNISSGSYITENMINLDSANPYFFEY